MNQFLRFCVVGSIGFVIDAGILQLFVFEIGLNPYLARVISFVCAASATWLMNRVFTFKITHKPSHAEWIRYLSFMLLGAAANYGAFALCISTSALVQSQPWIGVAAGSVAGLGFNFLTSKLFVFDRS